MEEQENSKEEGKLPKGTFSMGSDWAALTSGGRMSRVNLARMKSMSEILTNLKAVKGDYYVSLLLTTINMVNLNAALIAMSRPTKEDLHQFVGMMEDNLWLHFATMISAHYKGLPEDSLKDMVTSIVKDFESLMDAAQKITP